MAEDLESRLTDNLDIGPPESAPRTKRSRDDLTIEVMLVADKTLHQFHRDNLRTFMLTVVNVVSFIKEFAN